MSWSGALALLLATGSGCSQKSATAPGVAAAQASRAAEATRHQRYQGQQVHLEGRVASGALWEIDKPAAWNGDLVLYLHGYSSPTDPVALPHNEAIRDSLVARGFAVAASSYSSNGYAVREGVRESDALNEIFEDRIGHARRTYLFGQSLGGLIGLILAQRHSDNDYDGAFLVCGIVGGSTEEVQYIGDIRVLFDTVYPGVLAGDLYHPPVITNLNAQVVGPVVQAVTKNPQGLGIIQLLARHPLAGNNGQELVTSLVTVLGFQMQGGGDLFARAGSESFFDNAGWQYSSPALPAALLTDINTRVARYTRTRGAAAFLQRFGEPTRRLRIPLMTLHTMRDPVVPVFHEDLLAQVALGPNLVQRRVDRYGHTPFSAGELMPHFNDLVNLARAQRHDDDHDHDDGVVAGGTVALPLPPGSTATTPLK
jgi:pimeloyl-ACP methyl ester carboxylesterase